MVIEEEATSLKENSVQVNKITKEQMLSNHELKRSLSEITSKSKNQILSVYDSVNQLFIDDTYASQIVSGDYESYNIPAYKINQDSTVLYNVFLEKQMDGTFESYLLSYYYQNNVDADLNQEVISFSKEQLSTNFQINYDFRTCGLSGVTCNCYTLMREYVDLENYVYRWDYVACTNESIDDGDSASGGGIPSNDPPDSNVPSDPIDSNPIDTNPEENQGSNGGSSDGNATIGATDSNCPQSSVPSLGDGRCGSLSEPVFPLNVVSQNTQALFDSLNNPNEIELYNFIQNPQQNELRNNINNFIRSEYNSQEAQAFVKWLIEFEIINEEGIPCGLDHDCLASINTMAAGLRRFHGPEGDVTASYFEDVVTDIENSFDYTNGDIQDIYDTFKSITRQYNAQMMAAIVGAYVDVAEILLEIALFEVGAPAAIKLLQKIPISWVLRGTRLNNTVSKVGIWGTRSGGNNSIRIFKTNVPVSKASETFTALTKDKIGNLVIQSNGSRIANMGNGNFITVRPVTASGSNFPATLQLNFPSIWNNPRIIKFTNL
jgi:hypothetical protein